MKRLNINYSQFGGKDTKHDKTQLHDGKGFCRALDYKGYLQGNGALDGQNVGVGSNYIGVSSGDGFGLCQYIWDAPDGNQYVIKYTSDGGGVDAKLIYWLNPTLTNASTALTAWSGTNLAAGTAIATNFVPSFAEIGSGSLLVALGPYGVYRLTPTASTLAAVAETALPASSHIAVANNRLWIIPCDESVLRWTPKGDYTRLLPKLSEIDADTYGIDYRYTLQSQGCDGNVVGLFACDAYKAVWTQNDLFIVVGNGDKNKTAPARGGKGFGLGGFKGFIYKDGILYWYSKYNGGRILGAVTGEIPGDRQQIHAVTAGNFALRIFDATDMVPDELKDCPTMDCEVVSFVCDTRSDWEDTTYKIYSKTGLDTTDEPGIIKIGDTALSTFTGDVTTDANGIIYDSWAVNGTNTISKTYDNNTETYCQYDVDLGGSHICPAILTTIWYYAGNRWNIISDSSGQAVTLISGTHTLYTTGISTSAILIKNRFLGTHTSNPALNGWLEINFQYELGSYSPVNKIVLTSLTLTPQATAGNTASVKLAEIDIYAGSGAAYLTSKVVKLTGLTSANNAVNGSGKALGRFLLSYMGTVEDGTGGLVGSTFAVPQIRGDDASFADDAADSGANSWYSLTGTDYTQGVDLTTASAGTGAMTFDPDDNGNLWVQFRVPFTVSSTGKVPKLDSAGFYFWKGNNIKSIAPMGYKNDQVFACVRSTSDSSQPDKEVCVNTKTGEISVIEGKQVYSYLNYNDKCYVAEGYKIYEQYAGGYNYIEASDTPSAIPRVWESGEISVPGHSIYPHDINVAVSRFDSSQDDVSSSVLVASETVDWVKTGRLWDVPRSVLANDGCLYSLIPASNGGAACGDLYLYKINWATGASTSFTIEDNSSASQIADFGMAWDNSKGKIYIIYTAYYGTTYNRAVKFCWFDVEKQTLSTASTIATAESGYDFTTAAIALIDDTIHVVAGLNTTSTDGLYHYYSTNYEDSSPTWSSAVAIDTGTSNYYRAALMKMTDGNLGCFWEDSAGAGLYFTRYINDSWETSVTVSSNISTNLTYLAHGGYDHLFVCNDTNTGYVYLFQNGVWEQAATIASVKSALPMSAAPLDSENIIVLWGNSESNVIYSKGLACTWSAAATYPNTLVCYNMWINKDTTGSLYAITQLHADNDWYITPIFLETSGLPLTCNILTNNGVYPAFIRTSSIYTTTHLPESGRCTSPGKCDWCRLRIASYGETKITGIGFSVDVSES